MSRFLESFSLQNAGLFIDYNSQLDCFFQDEVCLAGYRRFKNDGISPAPLTKQEEEMQRLRKTEAFHVSFDCTDPLSPAKRTASGVSFPVSNAVIDSVNQMVKKKLNYIQLKIGEYHLHNLYLWQGSVHFF